MTRPFPLGDERMTSAQLVALAAKPAPSVVIADVTRKKLRESRALVEKAAASDQRVYGINTGFGYLSDVAIEFEKLEQLQVNLIRSHACGVGEFAPKEIVRGCLVLRAHTFLRGGSGVREATLDQVLAFLKHDILPMLPCQGSVGASGDLAPLAHLALGLMGEGDVFYKGQVRPGMEVLEEVGLQPLRPGPKEGLSLINGTHYMTVIAAHAVEEMRTLVVGADVTVALSLDAIRGTLRAFDERIHQLRGQKGQQASAANILSLYGQPSPLQASHVDCGKVQDPYSFRCAPQVHGAARDALGYVEGIIDNELNAITDNPLVFDNGDIISGGNFHGEPVSMAMDFLGIAAAEIGSIAERRIEKITNPGTSGLPPFVAKDSGLNSGYMIPHVVAASLVSENKVLTHPASVDSIPTSAEKEDHVSMGPIAARKTRDINRNVRYILAIETLAACQGLDLLAPLKTSGPLERVREAVRRQAPKMDMDRSLHKEIEAVAAWIGTGGLQGAVAELGVELG